MLKAVFTCCLLSFASLTGVETAMAETRVPQTQHEIQLGFAPLVKETGPAVVNIYAKRVVEVRESPFSGDPFFQNLFRDFGSARPRVQNSLGSGVILSSDGIVVSNYHVVGMATDIRVVLNDRREFTAQVLLADEANDLAILQLDEPEEMPHLTLRDSDSVEVGELVLAIGNPFGVGQTVSSGIVSGLARTGASGQPVDADIAESLGLDRPGGILISDLHPASPFLAAGIRPGDVILAVDGQPVTNGAEMIFRMSVAGLGGTAEMAGIFGGKPDAVDVALIAPPDSPSRNTLETSEETVLPRVTVSA